MAIQAPRGTQDILPTQSCNWQYIEQAMREVCRVYGYREIRTPVFEHTELFLRGVGDTTDIVQKEMYTFEDRGGRSITLKPEGTAGAVRALLQSGLMTAALPLKAFYLYSPHCRYEKPQSGRLREHHQFGIECFGAPGPWIDAEIIALAWQLLCRLGIPTADDGRPGMQLMINSIGCPECRAAYYAALKQALAARHDSLCELCRDRAERNPLRVLDCKQPGCQAVLGDVPNIIDHLCPACAEHFDGLQQALTQLGIAFTINPRIVRGLDYYTRTVFEIVSPLLGAQSTICGGGRYDGLVAQLDGPATPGIGFGMGMERLLLLLDSLGVLPAAPPVYTAFVANVQPEQLPAANRLVAALRAAGISADCEHTGRSIKGQFKFADKLGCPYVITIGPDELAAGQASVRDMAAHEATTLPLEQIPAWLAARQ